MNTRDLRHVIGTLAHNRHFSAREITEYTRFDLRFNGPTAIKWLCAHGYITRVARGFYYPTSSGWSWIESAIED
jgi:hypothetical protein